MLPLIPDMNNQLFHFKMSSDPLRKEIINSDENYISKKISLVGKPDTLLKLIVM